MKELIRYLVIFGSLVFFSSISSAATAICQASNNRTGQTFSADGGGPTQPEANQVAQSKAMEKCHEESSRWPGQCFAAGCTPT